MKKLKKIFKRFFAKIARRGEISEALQALTFWEYVGVVISTLILFVCVFAMTSSIIKKQTVLLPAFGGTLNEGVVGEPNLFNPLLSIRNEDQEVVSLVFSGILRKEDKAYVNDLAEEISRSKDGKNITVKLKPDLKFHNGDTLNADDVIFTINMIKDPRVKSPLKVLWDTVTVSKKDDLTVLFSLKQSYGFFDDMLTVGIISEDVFKNQPREEFSTLKEHQEPIGSGPFKLKSIKTTKNKIVSIKLKYFRKYNPNVYIKNISITYYPDEESLVKAFKRGDIDLASGVSPESTVKQKDAVLTSQLNRSFSIFINRKNVTYSPKTIEALNQLIPRELIVSDSLEGLGKSIYTPYPINEDEAYASVKERVEKALSLIEADGWKHLPDGTYAKDDKILSVSLTSPDTSELRNVIDKIITAFRDVGINADVTYVDPSIFTDEIIRPRQFDFVLFGQVLHTPADLYAFWHSSQKNDPGLNIGSYTNKTVDNKLESLLKEVDTKKQEELIKEIDDLIKNDTGAFFIFSPKYIILSDNKAEIQLPDIMSYSKDRYQKVQKWYIEKNRILKIFNH